MRRNRDELRLLARTVVFFAVREDFLCDLAGFDGGPLVELVPSEACANTRADEHTRALKHSTKRMNLENPATFLQLSPKIAAQKRDIVFGQAANQFLIEIVSTTGGRTAIALLVRCPALFDIVLQAVV